MRYCLFNRHLLFCKKKCNVKISQHTNSKLCISVSLKTFYLNNYTTYLLYDSVTSLYLKCNYRDFDIKISLLF